MGWLSELVSCANGHSRKKHYSSIRQLTLLCLVMIDGDFRSYMAVSYLADDPNNRTNFIDKNLKLYFLSGFREVRKVEWVSQAKRL